MTSPQLTNLEKADIDQQVAKVLRGLGNPEPPLNLNDVRALLELDRKFYSSTNTDFVSETISRLFIAGKQFCDRPMILWEAIQKRNLKALWIPDRKRILLDETLPSLKWRWSEAHEVGHSIIPWHAELMHGDDRHTLTFAAEQQIEAEANYAAGRLLFLQQQFEEQLGSSPLDYAAINRLSKVFGNTSTSTLWRAVECARTPTLGMVTQHPAGPPDLGKPMVRYFVRSPSFIQQFPSVTKQFLFAQLAPVCRGGAGPIGATDLLLVDRAGAEHIFHLEAFFNRYETLVLGVHRRVRRLALAI